MSGAHGHSHDGVDADVALPRPVLAVVFGALGLIAVITIIGVALLWPSHDRYQIPASFASSQSNGAVSTVAATVTSVQIGDCPGSTGTGTGSGYDCTTAGIRVATGHGHTVTSALQISPGPGSPTLHTGDHIRVVASPSDISGPAYYFADFARGTSLLWVGVIAAAGVVAIGRWRGLAAVVGLILTLLLVVRFLLPGLLEGKSPVLLGLVSGAVILFVVLYLAHGLTVRTSSALLSTLLALLVVTGLSVLAVHVTHLTGLQSDDNTAIQAYAPQISLTGLITCGFIIGSLGVLNDVTVTQTSAVWELHAANPAMGIRGLYRSAMRIGRDHIASTIYTLVLAYTGASLAVLVLFSVAQEPFQDVITGDEVAGEIVRALVGSVGLASAVPIATLLAALIVTRPDPGAILVEPATTSV